MPVTGRIALVTGAGRGVGRVCSIALAREGADVAVLARNAAEVEETAAEVRALGGRALAIPADVAVRSQVEESVSVVRRDLGPIGILIAAAGIARSAKFTEVSDEDWEEHLRVNLTGAFYAARAVIPDMLEAGWGRIVMIASVAARQPMRYTAAYTASKHALLGLTRALAVEFAHKGITANAVCPGWLDTEMTRGSIANIVQRTGRDAAHARRLLEETSPQRRLFSPEEVAALAVFLCSDAAAGINGQGIVLDGGGVMA